MKILMKNVEIINTSIKLINKGIASTIRVLEELCSCHDQRKEDNSSNYQYSVTEKEDGKGEEDDVDESEDEVVSNDDVAYNQWGGNNMAREGSKSSLAAVSVVNDTCNVVEEPRKVGAGVENEEGMPRVIISSTIMGSPRDTGGGTSVGFMKSISSQELHRPSINLNVVLDQAQSKGLIVGLNQGRLEWHKEDVQNTTHQIVAQPAVQAISGPVETYGQPNQKVIESKKKRVTSKSQIEQNRKKGRSKSE
ncbi:hypothetical protein LOK49_LG14G02106 [Camellia lanceoleosa]|uniref:Uncharacterized protein n=1 Tax=Camellia lanceoleosa TaxID=1840588 RepID=A0ACC0FAR2_9ERIC|nr:hypothetical protein LOK49_LG14G02106 [Camellia lanceoleosa]